MNLQPSLTRRDFLVRAALASSATACSPFGTASCFGAAQFSPPVTVFSKIYQELKLDFDQAAEVTAAAGLDGIDCPVRSGGEIAPERAADDLPRYAEALRKRSVRMLLITTGIVDVTSPYTKEILRTAKKLGIHYYRLGFQSHQRDQPLEAQRNQIKAQLKELAALNQELGVCAIFQNHSPGARPYFGGDLGELHGLVADFDPNQIGVAFDLGHALIVHGDDWASHFEQLKSHIKVAYIKDTQKGARFVPFGEGEFRRTDFFTRLKKLNLTAPLSMHIEFDWAKNNSKTPPVLVNALKDSLRVLKQWLAEA